LKLKYIICPNCGQVNPELMIQRVLLGMQAHRIKNKEKRMQIIKKLRSLSWEEFAKFVEVTTK